MSYHLNNVIVCNELQHKITELLRDLSELIFIVMKWLCNIFASSNLRANVLKIYQINR